MHYGWEIAVTRRTSVVRRAAERMYVSLNKRGEIVMNARAFSEIGPTAMVALFYDAERRMIGIKRPVRQDMHFFYARRYGRGRRMRIVRAAKMLCQFGISVERTLVFKEIRAERFEGEPMLVLELDSAAALG